MKTNKRTLLRALLRRLDDLLNPESIAHEGAREGSAILRKLSGRRKLDVLLALHRDSLPPQRVLDAFVLPHVSKKHSDSAVLLDAVRRLGAVGRVLAVEVAEAVDGQQEDAGAPEEKKPMPVLDLKINPGRTLEQHIRDAELAPRDFDGLGKMANLAALLEKNLKTLYAHPVREQNPFMMVGQVNMVAGTYMSALEKLHRMQLDVGIVEKRPEAMEVNVTHAGAFQTYIGELSGDMKQCMADFSDSFAKFVNDRKKKKS